ncbi:hypothetical protein LZV31_001983 [Listeria monocytogenes]|nr:hypothetical protein [Listeria monocytogenes]
MKRKTEKSHETLTNITAYPPKTWLIYSHKLTTSKTFSFFPLFRMKILNSLFGQCGLLPFSTLVFLCQKMKRKTEKSHETLTNITAYPPKTWLIYNHKLTTSKTFSFFPLFRMKIPNSLFDQCGLLPFSTLVF